MGDLERDDKYPIEIKRNYDARYCCVPLSVLREGRADDERRKKIDVPQSIIDYVWARIEFV